MNATNSSPSMLDWSIVGALAFVSTIILADVDLAPRDPRSGVAVVFAPWVRGADAAARAAAAGAALVRIGRYPFIIVVRPTSMDYSVRVRGEGAWAIFDPMALGGCLSRSVGAP